MAKAGRFCVAIAAATWALLGLSVGACDDHDHEEGLEVAVALRAAGPSQASAWVNREGFTVRVTEAYVATTSVELVACETTAFRRVLRALPGTLGEPLARAHSAASPTRLGDPVVEDALRSPGAEVSYGAIKPPPGDYCSVRWGVGPADGDAEGLPAGVDVVGKTLLIRGTYEKPGGAPVPFEIASRGAFELPLTFAVARLGEDRRELRVAILRDQKAWFDGVDFEGSSDEARGERVLANLRAGTSVEVR